VLLQAGASADAADKEGATALQQALFHGHAQFVRLLLDAASDARK
jgi:ankyrin repeat protein